MNPHQLSHEEYKRRKREGTLTPENRAAQFGDTSRAERDVESEYKAMLLDRLNKGLYLTKSATREAKRYKREISSRHAP